MRIRVEYRKGIEDVLSELGIESIKPGDVRVYSSLSGLKKGLPKGLKVVTIEGGVTEHNEELEITSFGIEAKHGRVPGSVLSYITYVANASVIRE